MKNNKNIIDLIFLIFLIIITICSFIKVILQTKNINDYENRMANKLTDVTIQGFISGESQEKVEKAFADQLPLSTTIKKQYNLCTNTLIKKFNNKFESKLFSGKYIVVGNNGICRIGGFENLLYKTYDKEQILESMKDRIENINNIINSYKDLQFYLYFIEKDSDINFETNEKMPFYNYIQDNIENAKISKFDINSFDEFRQYFYKTDHHWNYKGSYKGYTEILNMISHQEKPLKPLETIKLNKTFSGSKAKISGSSELYSEDFEVYRFEIPLHETFILGQKGEYGNQKEYFENRDKDINYANFYGGDNGEIEFNFNQPEKENILIIGESYDNAILELLASHFNKTYSIDLRNYEKETGHNFSFDEYIKEKNITKVLLIGNIDFYVMKEFNL